MYEPPTYLTMPDICKYLGLGRNRVTQLCQDHTHGFPAVKVGNRWQADAELLALWRADWYAHKFVI